MRTWVAPWPLLRNEMEGRGLPTASMPVDAKLTLIVLAVAFSVTTNRSSWPLTVPLLSWTWMLPKDASSRTRRAVPDAVEIVVEEGVMETTVPLSPPPPPACSRAVTRASRSRIATVASSLHRESADSQAHTLGYGFQTQPVRLIGFIQVHFVRVGRPLPFSKPAGCVSGSACDRLLSA